jgi:hypothetical protein
VTSNYGIAENALIDVHKTDQAFWQSLWYKSDNYIDAK